MFCSSQLGRIGFEHIEHAGLFLLFHLLTWLPVLAIDYTYFRKVLQELPVHMKMCFFAILTTIYTNLSQGINRPRRIDYIPLPKDHITK